MDGFVTRFFTFEKMIATILIKILYWIGLVGIVLIVLAMAFGSFGQGFGAGLGGLIAAPFVGILMLIVWRFLCELYLVAFGIYDRLGNIQNALDGGAARDISSISDPAPKAP